MAPLAFGLLLCGLAAFMHQGVVAFRRGAPLRYNEKLPSPLDCLPEMLKSLGAMPGDAAEAVCGGRGAGRGRLIWYVNRCLRPMSHECWSLSGQVGARDLAEVRIVEQAGRLTPVLVRTCT
jgi:hypothetical protein